VCSPAICSKCRKVTYSGCGGRVSQVLAKPPPRNTAPAADKTGIEHLKSALTLIPDRVSSDT
jgi:hypothetical protein